MKKYIFILFAFYLSATLAAQTTAIPDTNFEQALIDLGIDSDGTLNGQVDTADVVGVEDLDLVGTSIQDLTGIQDFAALKNLDAYNNPVQIVDLSQNIQLEVVSFYFALFETLDLTNNPNLINLYAQQCSLQEVILGNKPFLENIYVGTVTFDLGINNFISSIDVDNCPNLKILKCDLNNISSLNLQNSPLLEELDVSSNNLSTLDLSNNNNLRVLRAGKIDDDSTDPSNPNLQSLDLSNNSNLEEVRLSRTNLYNLNLKNGNNENIDLVAGSLISNLSCVQVDDATAATNGEPPYDNWYFDEQVSYSEDCSLGIPENNFEIGLYPNPIKNFVTITSNGTAIKKIKVLTISGTKIMGVLNHNSIDLSSLSSGVYFLLIETDKGKVIKKVVKL